MNSRENIMPNSRENIMPQDPDPEAFQDDRLSSATRSVRKSERGVSDSMIISRGGNNGDGSSGDYDGMTDDVFGDQNQASYQPSPDYVPRYEGGCDEGCSHGRDQHNQQQLPQ